MVLERPSVSFGCFVFWHAVSAWVTNSCQKGRWVLPSDSRDADQLRQKSVFGLSSLHTFHEPGGQWGDSTDENTVTEGSGPWSSCVKPLPVKFCSALTSTAFGASSAGTEPKISSLQSRDPNTLPLIPLSFDSIEFVIQHLATASRG